MEFTLRPIAFVRNDRAEAIDDDWDSIRSTVELADDVPSESLHGLDDFSHIEIVLFANLASETPPAPWHRRPRGNPDWPDVGVFAQRNKDRPNRLLLSVVAVDEVRDRSLIVRGLDAIDGTPVLDIKPVFRWSGPRGELRVAQWSDTLGEGYF